MYRKMSKILGVVIVGVIFLMSMGYSVLNRELSITGELAYRPRVDIRITNLTQGTIKDATIQYADYSKNEINFAYKSTTASATIALTVEVTNFTDTEMGILNIENLPATATITGYTLKNKLTNANSPLTAGKSTTFTITIKPTAAETKAMTLKFDFEPFYKVTYEGFSSTSGYKTEILKGDSFIQSIGTNTQICKVSMNGSAISNYTFANGVIGITSVTGDIVINGFTSVMEEPTTPNPPELNGDMIPVYYYKIDDKTGEWRKADESNLDNNWYDYSNQQWANAVTIIADKREEIKKYEVNTPINMDYINTMWVWIPRYSYTIKSENGTNYYGKKSSCTLPTRSLPGEIDVKFISKEDERETGSAKYIGDKASGWYTNEAFDFPETDEEGNNTPTKRAGIWVAKFETTGSLEKGYQACINTSCNVSSVTVKPGVKSLTNYSISSFFFMARSMQTNSAQTYGFEKTKGDLHMMKNDEWGAVAYLSQSRYGKYGNSDYTGANKEIYQNKSSGYITGSSNGTPSQYNTISTQYEYNDMTNLGPGQGQAGPGASTTGNITGIYDMSGGAYEYVMGVLEYDEQGVEDNEGKIATGSSGFKGLSSSGSSTGSYDLPYEKYYNKYKSVNPTSSLANLELACNGGVCYGHALSETSSWYSDSASLVSRSYPWSDRGCSYNSYSGAGVFCASVSTGLYIYDYSCRLTFAP